MKIKLLRKIRKRFEVVSYSTEISSWALTYLDHKSKSTGYAYNIRNFIEMTADLGLWSWVDIRKRWSDRDGRALYYAELKKIKK